MDIETLIQNNSIQIEKRDKEIKKLKDNVKESKNMIKSLEEEKDEMENNLIETKKKIPLRPEEEYIEEI